MSRSTSPKRRTKQQREEDHKKRREKENFLKDKADKEKVMQHFYDELEKNRDEKKDRKIREKDEADERAREIEREMDDSARQMRWMDGITPYWHNNRTGEVENWSNAECEHDDRGCFKRWYEWAYPEYAQRVAQSKIQYDQEEASKNQQRINSAQWNTEEEYGDQPGNDWRKGYPRYNSGGRRKSKRKRRRVKRKTKKQRRKLKRRKSKRKKTKRKKSKRKGKKSRKR